jgi:hypothetical protein
MRVQFLVTVVTTDDVKSYSDPRDLGRNAVEWLNDALECRDDLDDERTTVVLVDQSE